MATRPLSKLQVREQGEPLLFLPGKITALIPVPLVDFCISVTRTEPRGPLQWQGKPSGTVLGWPFREDRVVPVPTDLPLEQRRPRKFGLRSSTGPRVEKSWLHLVECARLPPGEGVGARFSRGKRSERAFSPSHQLFSVSSCFLPPIRLVLPVLLFAQASPLPAPRAACPVTPVSFLCSASCWRLSFS